MATRIDPEHLGLDDLDPGSAQVPPVGTDLLRTAGSGHHPHERRGEPVGRAAIDEHDSIGGVQRAAKGASGHQSAGSTAEHYNRAVCHGGTSPGEGRATLLVRAA
ncbi:MAG: hypothetical protein FD127_1602 [Acidimicrobiaceae bacterium]|nr:MAG: hypothetical protein FD127_1602 [Acidimicrobiaceae bacterium]